MKTYRLQSKPSDIGEARIEEYFGMWACYEQPMRQILATLENLDLVARVAQPLAQDPTDSTFEIIDNNAAYIQIRGIMTKAGNSFSDAGSTVRARRQIRAAVNDERIESILLVIESPGGTVSGTRELGEDIAAAAKVKPFYAYIEDIGASAAYWVASQATKIYANASALVGSIGTYMAVTDISQADEKAGVKVTVIRAGEFKGAGTPGTEITDAQIAEWQRLVDELNMFFVEAVSMGRQKPTAQIAAIADGRVHVAADAIELGLIDAVATFDEVADIATGSTTGVNAMADKPDKQPATLAQLDMTFPKATSDWKLDQLRQGATLESAQVAWQSFLETQLAEQQAKIDETEKARAEEKAAHDKELAKAKEQASAAASGVGTAGVGAPEGSAAEAGSDYQVVLRKWNAAVDEKAAAIAPFNQTLSPMARRQKAIDMVRAEHPEWQRVLQEGIPIETAAPK